MSSPCARLLLQCRDYQCLMYCTTDYWTTSPRQGNAAATPYRVIRQLAVNRRAAYTTASWNGEDPRAGVGVETVKPHRVLWQLDVDDEQRRQPLFPRQVRLITQCRQRRQLHMLRDVAQPEVEGIEVHVQQPAEFVVWCGFTATCLGHVRAVGCLRSLPLVADSHSKRQARAESLSEKQRKAAPVEGVQVPTLGTFLLVL